MARETQKEKIERLENSLKNAHEEIQKLNDEISKLYDNADNNFNGSAEYVQMNKRIRDLELHLKLSEESSEHNRKMYEHEIKANSKSYDKIQELKNEIKKLKNEDYTLEDIKELEVKVQNARKNSDKWHKEYCDKDMKYKELDKKYQELQSKTDKFETQNRKLKLDKEVLKEVLKKVKELEMENKQLKDNGSHSIGIKKHNERGAGRKSRFTDLEIETIKMYRIQGKTIKEIAETFKCSVGLIHKIINEN